MRNDTLKHKKSFPFSVFRFPSQGFTLIELLVVIAVIAVIVGFAMPNFLGVRERARDTKRKSELVQLKNALRMYYNDYQKYPAWTNGLVIVGCGASGTSNCPPSPACASGAEFVAGGTDGCGNVYMRKLPIIGTAQQYRYYQVASGDDFRLKINLDNPSDSDIVPSQARCPIVPATNPSGSIGSSWGSTDYVLCAD